jgi:hypothetical protein
VDWRFGPQKWALHHLPAQLETLLIKYVALLGLHIGSIDLRLRDNGEYVFLEINPGGQFLFLEIDAGLPISQYFASFLMNPLGWKTELYSI